MFMTVYLGYRNVQERKQQLIRENTLNRGGSHKCDPTRATAGDVGRVSSRNNFTLLEHFTSNAQSRQRFSWEEFYFTDLYLCSERCHHSFPASNQHPTGSFHLWAPQNTFVHCTRFVLTLSRNALDSELAGCSTCPVFFQVALNSTDMTSCNRRMHVTGKLDESTSLRHHFNCLSHYLSFGLLQLNLFKWSRRLYLKHFILFESRERAAH